MRVLNLGSSDTGGNGVRTAQAFRSHSPDWKYSSVFQRTLYLNYPHDESFSRMSELAEQSDILQVNNNFTVLRRAGLDALGKPIVMMHHGTQLRKNPQDRLEQCDEIGATNLVSTLDLHLLAPEKLIWSPTPYDLDWLATFRKEHTSNVLRIGHAPTDKDIKDTLPFIQAVKWLQRKLPVELVLIQHKPWEECLRLKGRCDVYYDQVRLGYGNNAIEAWGMGIPVIAGAAPATLAEMERRFGQLPFYAATRRTIAAALMDMYNPEVRAEYARRGLEHVRRFHSEKTVVDELRGIYGRVVRGQEGREE